ncbi:SusC/RagA family TonB-linked outer membrane protein [Flavobacterium taihuense]|uniref:SusC/RagA family TonB-linked outer membrane protein n=1 Tax=Flavobacterium taihuense TaxID=2857508 RepID=A0ABS6XWK3_9FLAO|nr:SusC/RagA family TonB-linked outer membrane protein [Flavobacterium taihuense]MBW4361050.1 SusC/RagA family TonB-linked outer membrane protein [Flavobacterium taihuense]
MNNFSLSRGGRAFCFLFFMGAMLSFSPVQANNSSRQSLVNTQQHQVQGTVTDGSNPLAGVSISIQGKSNVVTATDYSGRYTLSVAPQDVLVFAYVGYRTQTVYVQGRTTINISLQENTTQLQEVKINAGYYSVKNSERTGSISKITAKDIEKQPVTNVLATMQGRMAGVNITQNSGVPGSGFEIQIRGQNSLRADGNQPLYIIDGVPYASDAIGSFYTSSTTPRQTSPINSINPGDIESLEVLKDADATAIYGSRGANGVVLITTKRGKEGTTRFSATVSSGFGQVTRFMDLMHTPEYLQMRREAYANDGITDYPADAYDVNGRWDPNRETDWQKALIGGTSSYTTVQSSLSGGSAQTQFLLSGNYSKETTVFPGDFEYVKGNMHVNLNHASENKKFRINFTGGYTAQDNFLPPTDFTREALTIAPNAPALYDANGNVNWEDNTFNNPLGSLAGKFRSLTDDLIANSVLSYEWVEGLVLKSSFGYSDLRHDETNTQPSTMYNPAYGLGSEASLIFENKTNRQSWIVEPQISWNRKMGSGKMETLVGSTFQEQTSDQLVTMGSGFSSNSQMDNPGSAAHYAIQSSNQTVYKYQAFFGRVNFNWLERYIVNVTGRRDGSSRFGPGKQFATFGALGAAWLFGNEAFMKNHVGFLSFGKLRGSYGTTGNDQIGDYQYLDTYTSSGNNYQGISGLSPSRLFNPNFGWETNTKLELALETGFLEDRIFTTLGWYRNRSSSQLVGIPLPGTTGFTSLQANLDATVQNTGIEISIRTVNISNSNFSWISNLNFTQARNELLSFPNLDGSPYRNQYVIGQPLNITKVYHYTGLNPQTGVYQFEDVNGDGAITAANDRKTIKNLNPQFYGGLQNQLHYGPVQLDFLFQFVKQENFNPTFMFGMPGTMTNQPAAVTEHWQQAGDNEPYQVYSSGVKSNIQRANTRHAQSDAGISDASYIRLKNISLSYDVPERWTGKMKLRFSLQGQNMLTFTKYKGADPEFKTAGFLPPLRIYTSSVQITF